MLTDNTPHDSSQVKAILDETLTGEANDSEANEGLSTVGADEAYDTFDIYDAITDRRAPGDSVAKERENQKARQLRRTASAPR